MCGQLDPCGGYGLALKTSPISAAMSRRSTMNSNIARVLASGSIGIEETGAVVEFIGHAIAYRQRIARTGQADDHRYPHQDSA
jgi:hypothetical protein